MLKPVLVTLGIACAAAPALAQRFEAELDCVASEGALNYDCEIRLIEGAAPVEGAVFDVKADMPEMPMAHNLPPLAAKAGEEPGSCRFPLHLEMEGRWTLRLEFSAPRRDIVIVDQVFPPHESAEPENAQANRD